MMIICNKSSKHLRLEVTIQNSLARKMCSDGRTFEALAVAVSCLLSSLIDNLLWHVVALPVAMCLFDLISRLKGHQLFVRCPFLFKNTLYAQHICISQTEESRLMSVNLEMPST